MSTDDTAPASAPASVAPSARPHTRWPFAAGFGLIGAIVVGVIVIAFAWPSATAKAHDLPVGVSGPASQVSSLRTALAKLDPDPFALHTVSSRADAVRRIEDRSLYGAILLGDSPEVLTSSAASTASNQALRGVATQLQQTISSGAIAGLEAKLQQLGSALAAAEQHAASGSSASGSSASAGKTSTGSTGSSSATGSSSTGSSSNGSSSNGSSGTGSSASGASGTGSASGPSASGSSTVPTVKITDVVALSSHDKTGAGLSAAAFPIALGGMLGGVLLSLLVVGVIRRLLALLVYAVAAGAVVALVLQTTLHALQGTWIVNAAALGLAMLATAAVVVGFNALIGSAGIAVGSVITILIGNPISGAAIPYQFIAAPWGAVGQYFVPGAAATLVRSLSYFPDADTSRQWIVLGAWAVGGLLLAVAGHFRSRAPVPLAAAELAPAHEHGRHAAA